VGRQQQLLPLPPLRPLLPLSPPLQQKLP